MPNASLIHLKESLLSEKLFGTCWIQRRITSGSSAKGGLSWSVLFLPFRACMQTVDDFLE
jgi:hypothetical protein